MENQHFKQTWKSKLDHLKDLEKQDDGIRKGMIRKNQEDLKKQMEQKQKIRENNIRRDLEED